MLNKNVETFLGCDADYEESSIVLIGAPYDCTTSNRPGARFACRAMRSESEGLETFSPFQNLDLCDVKVFDSGDLQLGFGDAAPVLESIRARVLGVLCDKKLPFLIGGEHLVTLGAVQAAAEIYPDLHIIHFDAHADVRGDYLGVKLSHACVIRRCWEILGDGRIYQFGIRSGERQEFAWAETEGHTVMRRFDFEGLSEVVRTLGKKPVYLTVDLDVLDPSAFPGTGTPEAGGVSFLQLQKAVCTVCEGANVVGCDVTELSPPLDASGCSTATACKVVREMLLCLARKFDSYQQEG